MTRFSNPADSELLPPSAEAHEEPWLEVQPFPDTGARHSFVSGKKDSKAIRVRYFARESTREFVGRAWFGPEAEGPPGHVHGGAQAALLDEGMGAAAWFAGHPVLAAKIEVNFKRPLPLGSIVFLRTEIERVEASKIHLRASLLTADGGLYTESIGLFIEIPFEELAKKLKKPSGK
jgi:acyl-CoA hydrolase